MKAESLGQRMKEYENCFDIALPKRIPIIIRLDGRAFHTLTKRLQLTKPFDDEFRNKMAFITKGLCESIMNSKMAYLQSDEISILLMDYPEIEKECWFGNRIQKIVSVSASLASSMFTKLTGEICSFDSRVFVMPPDEVCNYFIWRQQDMTRNSVQMVGQANFSSKELNGINNSELQDKLFAKGINWNNLPTRLKRGSCIIRDIETGNWIEDLNIPIFIEKRGYINQFIPYINYEKIDLNLVF